MAAFLLKWNKFSEHIVTALEELRENDEFTDVTLSCGDGKYISAHKVLLSVCSSYFKETFKNNPCKHPIIIFNGVDFTNLRTLITFIYHGEVNIQQDLLPSFLQTAKLLQIKGLTDFSEEDHPAEQNNHNTVNINQSRNSRSVSPLAPQNTYGFPSSCSSAHDPTADTISPILKSLSTLVSTASNATKRPHLQPASSNGPLSNFVNFLDIQNSSSDSKVPLTTATTTIASNNNNCNTKVARPHGTKTSDTSRSRPNNGNIVNHNIGVATSSIGSLDGQSSLSDSSNLNDDPVSHHTNTMTIKNEQGEHVYEEEFPISPMTTTPTPTITSTSRTGQVKTDSVIVSTPVYVRRSNSTTTATMLNKQGHNEIKMGRNDSSTASVLQEALLGRKRSSSNNFNTNHNYHHHNFLKSKDTATTKLSPNHINANGGPPKLQREVSLLNTSLSPRNHQQQQLQSCSKSQSQPHLPQSRPNLVLNQHQNRNLRISPFSNHSPIVDSSKLENDNLPTDLEMEKIETNTAGQSTSLRGLHHGVSKTDLARQDEFMIQLDLLRNHQPSRSNSHVPPVPSSSSSFTSYNLNTQQKPRSTFQKYTSGDNNYSVSHQLLKSAKATVRAKEKQQGQSGTTSAAVIKARASKTRNSIGPSGYPTGIPGGATKIRRMSSYTSSIKSKTSTSNHNRNDTGMQGPYTCSLCGKTYVHHRSLNDHKKFHTGATRCPACHKSFSKVANLRAHRCTVIT